LRLFQALDRAVLVDAAQVRRLIQQLKATATGMKPWLAE